MDQNVGWFDVSMDNVHRSQVLTSYRNLISSFSPIKINAFFHSLFKRTSLTKLCDNVVIIGSGIDIDEGEDVWMINFLKDPDLIFQQFFAMRFDIVQIDNLNSNNLLFIIIFVSLVDRTGKTASNTIIQFVTVRSNPLFRISN